MPLFNTNREDYLGHQEEEGGCCRVVAELVSSINIKKHFEKEKESQEGCENDGVQKKGLANQQGYQALHTRNL